MEEERERHRMVKVEKERERQKGEGGRREIDKAEMKEEMEEMEREGKVRRKEEVKGHR